MDRLFDESFSKTIEDRVSATIPILDSQFIAALDGEFAPLARFKREIEGSRLKILAQKTGKTELRLLD